MAYLRAINVSLQKTDIFIPYIEIEKSLVTCQRLKTNYCLQMFAKMGSQLVKPTNKTSSSATQVKPVIQLEKMALRCTKMSITWRGKPKSMITCNARRSLSEVNSKSHSTMTGLKAINGLFKCVELLAVRPKPKNK